MPQVRWLFSPFDGRQCVRLQEGVSGAEVATPDKGMGAAQGRQGRWVIGLQDQMARRNPLWTRGCIDEFVLGLRMRAPQHEDHGLFSLGHGGNHLVGPYLPTPLGMAGGQSLFYRQDRVEQEHALLNPTVQLATEE